MIETLVCVALAKSLVVDKIKYWSEELGAYPEIVSYIINNESKKDRHGDLLPCGDGDQHLSDPDGNAHRSRGIAQINEYWHPEVSDTDAYDPDFAIRFVIDGLRKGKCSEWTTCRAFKKLHPKHPYFFNS